MKLSFLGNCLKVSAFSHPCLHNSYATMMPLPVYQRTTSGTHTQNIFTSSITTHTSSFFLAMSPSHMLGQKTTPPISSQNPWPVWTFNARVITLAFASWALMTKCEKEWHYLLLLPCPHSPSFPFPSSLPSWFSFLITHTYSYSYVIILTLRYLTILLFQHLYSTSHTQIGFTVVSALRKSVGADIMSYWTRDQNGSHEATGYMWLRLLGYIQYAFHVLVDTLSRFHLPLAEDIQVYTNIVVFTYLWLRITSSIVSRIVFFKLLKHPLKHNDRVGPWQELERVLSFGILIHDLLCHSRDTLPTGDSVAYWECGSKGLGSGF